MHASRVDQKVLDEMMKMIEERHDKNTPLTVHREESSQEKER